MPRASHPRLRVLEPSEAVRLIEEACDRLVDKATRHHDPPATCRSGCDHCCRQPVFVTPLEGLAIREHLRKTGRGHEIQAARNAYLEAIQTRPEGSRGLEALRKSLSGAGRPPSPAERRAVYGPPCVFLRDGLCSIYPVRPLMCREHISFDDVAKCERDEPFFGLEKPRFDEVSAYLTRSMAGPRSQWFGVWDYEKAAALAEKTPPIRETELREILEWKAG